MAVKTKPAPTTSASDVDLIVHASHWNPFSVLGLHELPGEGGTSKSWVVQAFLPEARSAWVVDLTRGEPGKPVAMERIHPDGFYTAVFADRPEPFPLPPAARGTTRGIPGSSSTRMRSARS